MFESLELEPVISQTQLAHLELVVESPYAQISAMVFLVGLLWIGQPSIWA